MREVDALLERIDRNADIGDIRNNIAELLLNQLQEVRDRLGYWEKAHFANAIAALAWNIRARHQPTTSWLRLCLVNLEKALVPADQRDENYTPRDEQLNALTYEQLVEALEIVRGGG